jgi:signal transduction histidine kinase
MTEDKLKKAPLLAITDGDDLLVSATEPMAAMQLACGGSIPGVIAIPMLLETVQKARRYALKLSRAITAQTPAEAITAWVEIEPRLDGNSGCTIQVLSWQSTELPPEDLPALQARREEIDRHVGELTAILDAEQHILSVEAQSSELALLADRMRSGVGQKWTNFISPFGENAKQATHWRLLDGGALRVPGSDRTWRVRLFPKGVPGTQPTGFDLVLASDETQAEAVPDSIATKAVQASRGLIGRDVAPALRQPIARIIANAETIRTRMAGPLSEEYSNYAADIAAAGQHLLGLLDDLSDLEVVEAEDFSTAPDRIDLADVARRAAGILGVRARENGIVVVPPQLGESLPAIAEFRRALQVMLNLIGNAVRYSPSDAQVWIRLEDEGSLARVIVADQGPGLKLEDQQRIFEKFERLGRSGDGGSGLGLYISRRLARAMHGDLRVESAPGQGARFILELPIDLTRTAKPHQE